MNEGKKILIACDSPRSLLDFRGKLIEELKRNNKVSIYTPKIEQPQIRARLNELGIDIYESDLNPSNVSILADLKYAYKLYCVIGRLQPDIFFPYAFKPVIYGSFVANLHKIKAVTPMLTGLGYNFMSNGNKRTLVQRIVRTLLKISLRANKRNRLIFQNKDDYQTLLDAKTISTRNRTFVVNGSGVDLEHYLYTEPETEQINFLMVSRLINAKGIKEFYKAARTLKSKYNNASFTLIGAYDDNIDAISSDLFEKIKHDGTINYLGLVSDVRPFINKASVVVLPSYYGEGVPRCLLEAMAVGRPVVTCDSVGCKETVSASETKPNGFLIPVKSVSALTQAMEHFLLRPEDILSYGINGRDYVREKFDVHLVNKQMINIFFDQKLS